MVDYRRLIILVNFYLIKFKRNSRIVLRILSRHKDVLPIHLLLLIYRLVDWPLVDDCRSARWPWTTPGGWIGTDMILTTSRRMPGWPPRWWGTHTASPRCRLSRCPPVGDPLPMASQTGPSDLGQWPQRWYVLIITHNTDAHHNTQHRCSSQHITRMLFTTYKKDAHHNIRLWPQPWYVPLRMSITTIWLKTLNTKMNTLFTQYNTAFASGPVATTLVGALLDDRHNNTTGNPKH